MSESRYPGAYVHPTAIIAKDASILPGAVLHEGVCVEALAEVAGTVCAGAVVKTGAVMEVYSLLSAGCVLEEGACLSPGAYVLPRKNGTIGNTFLPVNIGPETFIGPRAIVAVSLGARCRVDTGVILEVDTLLDVSSSTLEDLLAAGEISQIPLAPSGGDFSTANCLLFSLSRGEKLTVMRYLGFSKADNAD